MKKILFAIAITMMFGFAASAQNDSFFKNTYNDDYGNRAAASFDTPTVPSGNLGGISGNPDAPLGSGLLVLTALGAGYAVARKKRS